MNEDASKTIDFYYTVGRKQCQKPSEQGGLEDFVPATNSLGGVLAAAPPAHHQEKLCA